MKEVKLEDLRQELDNDTDKLLIGVILYAKDCQNCDVFLNYVTALEDQYPSYKFWKCEVIDDLPLFAPAVLPYIAIFYNGVRVYEGLGDPGEGPFRESLGWWEDRWRMITNRNPAE
jgi:hypothetical protein